MAADRAAATAANHGGEFLGVCRLEAAQRSHACGDGEGELRAAAEALVGRDRVEDFEVEGLGSLLVRSGRSLTDGYCDVLERLAGVGDGALGVGAG